MLEIEYTIGDVSTSMIVSESHRFYLTIEDWRLADSLSIGEKLLARNGDLAQISKIKIVSASRTPSDLKVSHNHHYFVTSSGNSHDDKVCSKAPIDSLELIPYSLANKPSHFPDGSPTGNHAGPWVAARYRCRESNQEVIAWGRANNDMCAEDAAVKNLKYKLDASVGLHRDNTEISHAYVRKYARKGRLINKISPCIYCKANYGHALNDKTIGTSNLHKSARGYLPEN